MSEFPVVLIGYERQENLGLRSIKAYLEANGVKSMIVPFNPEDNEPVLSAIKLYKPVLTGFSVIFQYTLHDFRKLIHRLRENGIESHFTAGGHYPSLRPGETLDMIPELDSVVRFEGEITLHELLMNLRNSEQWIKIKGLAFRKGFDIIITETRPLIKDLNSLPFVARDEPEQMPNGINTAAMLSSRGCLYNCSFCSIRSFYGSSEGSLRRTRSPESVVNEMTWLYQEKQVRFFNFQDDDFAAKTKSQLDWIYSFLEKLEKTGLAHNIAWKISCRVDDLNRELLETMLPYGLLAVYIGVESGNEEGLSILNKNVSVDQNIQAIELLKEHDIAMSMGFMLFDPSSTTGSVRKNIDFLKKVGEDGYFPINFCKMLPYAGTPIEEALRSTNRLKGTITKPDYTFSDPVMDWYEFLVQKVFYRRNFNPAGIASLLQQIDFSIHLSDHFDSGAITDDFRNNLREITCETNMLAVNTLSSLLDDLLTNGIDSLIGDQGRIISLFEKEWRGEMEAEVKLHRLCSRAKFILKT